MVNKQKLRGIAIGMGCVLFSMISCRKEDISGPHTLADSTAVFSANVAGVDWKTDSVTAFLTGEYPGGGRNMTITGFGSKRVISFTIRDTTAGGANGSNDSTLAIQTYDVGSWGSAVSFGYAYNQMNFGPNLVWQTSGKARDGKATVTASDGVLRRVSGTFAFTANVLKIDSAGYVHADTVEVTNGVFSNIPYTYIKHP